MQLKNQQTTNLINYRNFGTIFALLKKKPKHRGAVMKVAPSIRSDIIEMSKTIGPNKLKNLTPAERKVVSLVVQNKSISKDQKYVLDNLMDKRLTEIKTMGQPQPSSTMGRIKKGIQNTLGLSVRSTDLREQIKAAADKEPKRTPKKGESTKLSEQAPRTEQKKTTEDLRKNIMGEAEPKKRSQDSTQKPLQRAGEFSIKSKSSKQHQNTTKTSEKPTEKQEKIAQLESQLNKIDRKAERLDKKSARIEKRAEQYPLGKKLTNELEEHEKYLAKVSEGLKNEPPTSESIRSKATDADLAFIKGIEDEIIEQTTGQPEMKEPRDERFKEVKSSSKEPLLGQSLPKVMESVKEKIRASFFHAQPKLFLLLPQDRFTSDVSYLQRGQSRIDELQQEVGKMVLPEDISVARRVMERIFSDEYQKGDIVLIPGGVFSRGASIDVENSNLG